MQERQTEELLVLVLARGIAAHPQVEVVKWNHFKRFVGQTNNYFYLFLSPGRHHVKDESRPAVCRRKTQCSTQLLSRVCCSQDRLLSGLAHFLLVLLLVIIRWHFVVCAFNIYLYFLAWLRPPRLVAWGGGGRADGHLLQVFFCFHLNRLIDFFWDLLEELYFIVHSGSLEGWCKLWYSHSFVRSQTMPRYVG